MNFNTKLYVTEEDLPNLAVEYSAKLQDLGITDVDEIDNLYKKFLKNNIVIKYSKKWQDDNLNYWIDLILNVPGGYWQFIELMQQPHVEYEHYKFKQRMSYEKENVTDHRAKIELREENYETYKYFHEIKQSKKEGNKNIYEVNVDGDFVVKIPKDL